MDRRTGRARQIGRREIGRVFKVAASVATATLFVAASESPKPTVRGSTISASAMEGLSLARCADRRMYCTDRIRDRGSTGFLLRRTTTAAMPLARRGSMTGPSTTTTGRSNSIPTTRERTAIAASHTTRQGTTPGRSTISRNRSVLIRAMRWLSRTVRTPIRTPAGMMRRSATSMRR